MTDTTFLIGLTSIIENLERAENLLLDTDERKHIQGVRTLRSVRLLLSEYVAREMKKIEQRHAAQEEKKTVRSKDPCPNWSGFCSGPCKTKPTMVLETDEDDGGDMEVDFLIEDVAALVNAELIVQKCRRCGKPTVRDHICIFCGRD